MLFNGQITDGDPGWTYYPVLLAYRLSPVTVLGLAITAAAMVIAPGRVSAIHRRICFHLTLFAALYIVILSTEPKKLDRYLLPPIVALDIVAALGTMAAIGLLAGKGARWRFSVPATAGIVVCGSLLVLQALFARQSAPYYITSVSTLKGGQTAALEDVSLGWGEGGKADAEAILDHPDEGIAFIARDEHAAAIGFAEASLRRDYVNGCSTSPVGFLEGLFVVPAFRRRGVARNLCRHAEDWAASLGCSEFASDVVLGNETSQRAHEALGFEETERVVYYRKLLSA